MKCSRGRTCTMRLSVILREFCVCPFHRRFSFYAPGREGALPGGWTPKVIKRKSAVAFLKRRTGWGNRRCLGPFGGFSRKAESPLKRFSSRCRGAGMGRGPGGGRNVWRLIADACTAACERPLIEWFLGRRSQGAALTSGCRRLSALCCHWQRTPLRLRSLPRFPISPSLPPNPRPPVTCARLPPPPPPQPALKPGSR